MWDFSYEFETAALYGLICLNIAIWTHNLLTIW